MVYRLLALDIDGTLLKSNNRLDRHTKEAVAFARAKGAAVTLVSGRHFQSAAKVAKALKLEHPIITHNGAFVSSSIDDPVFSSKIEHGELMQLVEFLETYQCQIRIEDERQAVANKSKQKNLMAKMSMGISEPLFYSSTYVDSLSGWLREHHMQATAVHVHLFNQDKSEILEAVSDYFQNIDLREENDALILEQKGTSKYNALVYLAQYLGVSLHDTVAVGAGSEDMEMITKTGLGVAMGNAPRKVKNQADWVTRSNDMNGVAYMVKEVFRKQMKVQV